MTLPNLATADLGMLTDRELAALLTFSVETRRPGKEWRGLYGPFATLGEAIVSAESHASTRAGAEVRVVDSDGRIR